MQNPLVEAWGDFLSNYRWSWFVTLTFREETKSFSGHRKFNAYMKLLERAAGGPITFFRVDELGSINGRFHIHALVGGVDHMRRLTWMDLWKKFNGYARFYPFDVRKGAAWYCAKYLRKANGDWELGGDVESFRISQPNLPLRGLRVPKKEPKAGDDNREPTQGGIAVDRLKKLIQNREARRRQLELAYFNERSKSECDSNEILAHFEDETRRKPR
jgi:hypothetical protein